MGPSGKCLREGRPLLGAWLQADASAVSFLILPCIGSYPAALLSLFILTVCVCGVFRVFNV